MPSPSIQKFGRATLLFTIALCIIGSLLKKTPSVPSSDASEPSNQVVTSNEVAQHVSERFKPYGVAGIAGIWNVFASDEDGVNACTAAAHNGDRTITFTMLEGNKNDLFIALNDPSWDLSLGKSIDGNIVFDKRAPIFFDAVSYDKDVLRVTLSGSKSVAVLDGILKGSLMTVGFFDPSAPRWKISLKGSKDVLVAHYLCMAAWQRMSK